MELEEVDKLEELEGEERARQVCVRSRARLWNRRTSFVFVVHGLNVMLIGQDSIEAPSYLYVGHLFRFKRYYVSVETCSVALEPQY